MEQAADRIAGFVDTAKNVGSLVAAGLSLGAVGTAEALVATSVADAQGTTVLIDTHATATTSRAETVEEYASITTKNAAGVTIKPQFGQFVLLEQCKDGSTTVHRKVTYDKTEQPLGDCNVGSKVTVAVKPLSGDWQNKTPSKKVLKATRKNNGRFTFTEQEVTPTPAPATPQPTPPSPVTVTTPPANTQTTPTTPSPPPPPPPTDQTIEVNTGALNSSGDTIPTPTDTFQYDWTCDGVDEGIVTLESDPQVLGSCPEGESGTVTEEAPLGTQKWTELLANPQSFTVSATTVELTFKDQENAAPPPPPGDPYTSGDVGVDISWPQCDGDEAPPSSDYASDNFGIVGVTDGLGYSTNPCLAGEAADFPSGELSLYVNTGWNIDSAHNTGMSPDVCAAGDDDCEAYDYGYNAGLYAYGAALSLGITSPTWWLDVETDNTWSSNTTQNKNSLQGEHDALIAEGATTVGVYSTTAQWDGLTGSWENDWPSWGATTWTTASQAATYCTGHEFTDGPSYLMQFTPTSELDQDYAC